MNGEGTLFLRNGNIYTGKFVNPELKGGQSPQSPPPPSPNLPPCDSAKYVNETKGAIRQGMLIEKNRVYEGSFVNYVETGQGEEHPLGLERENNLFVGEFINGLRNGPGLHRQGNSKWIGEWRNGLRYGEFKVEPPPDHKPLFYVNDKRVQQLPQDRPPLNSYSRTIGLYKIDENNLKTLGEKQYISPNVLKAYYSLLNKEYVRMASLMRRGCLRVKILNEAVENLVGPNFSESSIENMTNSGASIECPGHGSKWPLPIFDYFDVLLLPVQVYREHFSLIRVRVHRAKDEVKQKLVYRFEVGYMDSLRYEIEKQVEQAIRKYLANELGKLEEADRPEISRSIEEIKLRTPQDYNLPQQKNSYNCGVWVATYIKNILRELLTNQPTDWSIISDEQVSAMRKEIGDCLKFESVRIL